MPFYNPEERRIGREVINRFLGTNASKSRTSLKQSNFLRYLSRVCEKEKRGNDFREKVLITSEVENILLFIPIALLILSEFIVIRSEKSYVFYW